MTTLWYLDSPHVYYHLLSDKLSRLKRLKYKSFGPRILVQLRLETECTIRTLACTTLIANGTCYGGLVFIVESNDHHQTPA